MTKYREILRLASLGLSQQSIADSSGVSKKTVNRVLKRAKELNIFFSLDAHRCLIVSIRWILEIAKTGVLCPYQLSPFLDILSPQSLSFKVLWAMYSYAYQLSFFSRFISSVAVDSSLISFSSSCLSPAVRADPVFVSTAGKCSPVSSRTISFR